MIVTDKFKDRSLRLDIPMIVVEISDAASYNYRKFCKYLKIFDFSSLFLIRSIRDVAPPVLNKIPFLLPTRSNLLRPLKRYSNVRSGASRLTSD